MMVLYCPRHSTFISLPTAYKQMGVGPCHPPTPQDLPSLQQERSRESLWAGARVSPAQLCFSYSPSRDFERGGEGGEVGQEATVPGAHLPNFCQRGKS